MKGSASMYKRHRFPPEIIQHVVWLYHRFNLSSRDIEDLMAERGIAISYESIRLWCIKFGSKYAKRLKRRHCGYGDAFYLDEVFVKICGVQHYLWRAVDQDGEVVDVFLQRRRDGAAAKRFLKRLLLANGNEPRRIVTDKLQSYGVAHQQPCGRLQFIQFGSTPYFCRALPHIQTTRLCVLEMCRSHLAREFRENRSRRKVNLSVPAIGS